MRYAKDERKPYRNEQENDSEAGTELCTRVPIGQSFQFHSKTLHFVNESWGIVRPHSFRAAKVGASG